MLNEIFHVVKLRLPANLGVVQLSEKSPHNIHLIKHIYHRFGPVLLKYHNQLYMGAASGLSASLFTPDSAAGSVRVWFV